MSEFRLAAERLSGALIVLLSMAAQSSSGGRAVQPDARAGGVPLLRHAETALRLLEQSDYQGAVRAARAALEADPEDAMAHAVAGTVLFQIGDVAAAYEAFKNSVALAPDDSLASYGLALGQIAHGKRREALASLQGAERGGDRSMVLVARRYAQFLDGAQIAIADAGVPEFLQPAQKALQGMAAARMRDWKSAILALETAQAALPGDRIVQPAGLIMTFDPVKPLACQGPKFPIGNALRMPLRSEKALSGALLLTPEGLTASTSYVSYEVDGQPVALVNVRPYQYTWNSRTVANGGHAIAIVLYDQGGREINRSQRRIRTYNAEALALSDAEQAARTQIAAGLWQALTLRPDRCYCAYTLGMAHQSMSNRPAARAWFMRAAAVQPDYRDVHRQLTVCGGLEPAHEAVYGGLKTEKLIALTFDDGPKPGLTEPLLEVLVRENVPSTFFVIGRHVTEFPELTRKIADAGMEIANHSYNHRNLPTLTDADIARELLQTQATVQAVTGKIPRFVRPPGGNWSPRVAKWARYWGLTPCFWTVDVYDAEVQGAQQVANAVLKQVRPGSIVLMHNGKQSTNQALPVIIRELRARGYLFATVDTLLRRLRASQAANGGMAVRSVPPPDARALR